MQAESGRPKTVVIPSSISNTPTSNLQPLTSKPVRYTWRRGRRKAALTERECER